MKKYLPLALLGIVLVSACINGDGTGGGVSVSTPAVSISEFSVNPSQARSGQTVLAKLTIQNDGQRDIVKNDTYTGAFALLIHSDEWANTVSAADDAKPIRTNLRYARGDEKPVPQTYTWNVKAPDSKGIDTPTDFTGRIYYRYQTEAVTTVNVYPSSEAETAKDKTTTVVSKGPIEMHVEVNPDPPVIYSPNDQLTVTIKVRNVGGGVVFEHTNAQTTPVPTNTTIEEARLGKVSIVPQITSPNKIQYDTSCFQNGVQFFGKSTEETLTCGITVVNIPAAKSQYTMRFVASYGYYLDAKSSVTLKAR